MPDKGKPLTVETIESLIDQWREKDEEEMDSVYLLPLGQIINQCDNLCAVYVPENTEPFSIGQSYDEHPAQQIKCRQCGGVDFHIAMGSYYTAVRCVTCRWEACAHDG